MKFPCLSSNPSPLCIFGFVLCAVCLLLKCTAAVVCVQLANMVTGYVDDRTMKPMAFKQYVYDHHEVSSAQGSASFAYARCMLLGQLFALRKGDFTISMFCMELFSCYFCVRIVDIFFQFGEIHALFNSCLFRYCRMFFSTIIVFFLSYCICTYICICISVCNVVVGDFVCVD